MLRFLGAELRTRGGPRGASTPLAMLQCVDSLFREIFIVTHFGRPCGYGVQRTCWVGDEGEEIGGSERDCAREALQLFAVIVGEE